METSVWFDLAPDYGVLELDESITAPGPALELHVVWSRRAGAVAWWTIHTGRTLGFIEVGEA